MTISEHDLQSLPIYANSRIQVTQSFDRKLRIKPNNLRQFVNKLVGQAEDKLDDMTWWIFLDAQFVQCLILDSMHYVEIVRSHFSSIK